jgi:hypothetical protein
VTRTPRATAALALAAGLIACGNGGSANGGSATPETISVGGESVPVSRLRDAAAALCTARQQAMTDVNAARATYYDRSHDALHTLARALEPVDRALAARLLENKQRVEADLSGSGGATPGEVAANLGRLADVTRRGLGRLSIPAPACD